MFSTIRDRLVVSLSRLYWAALLLLTALFGTVTAPKALASEITIGSPVDGARIASSAFIRAHSIGCDGLAPTFFGYSIDDVDGIVPGETAYDIDVMSQAVTPGSHTIYFKAWTSKGACPVVSSTFTVDNRSDSTPQLGIPSNAVSSGDLDSVSTWKGAHDGGTPGSSEGTSSYPAKTPLYDDARKFSMTYKDQAGERWSTRITKDAKSTHFALDLYVYFPTPSEVKNLEMDINQVTAEGQTIILSTQCSGEIGYWEYGDTVGAHDHWKSTKIKCNPATWAANVWHHIQIGEHRDPDGFVTHDWVMLDGVYNAFEDATFESAHFDNWEAGDVNTQFQIEGANKGSGTVTAYIHKLTVYRW
jgi:hypothetical protein